MGTVYAEITLENSGDLADVKRGRIKKKDVRSVKVTAMADTGSSDLVINEDVALKLGLTKQRKGRVTLADGSKRVCYEMDPVRVHWEDRAATCDPLMAPNADEVLLGAIPMQYMHISVDPAGERLVARPFKMITHPM